MHAVIPELEAPMLRVAESQPEYEPVTVALVAQAGYWIPSRGSYNTVVMAFRLTDAERARIAAGEDVYIALLTYGRPQQPILVFAGKQSAGEILGVPVHGDSPAETERTATATATTEGD